jgi:hypothetical protein
MITGAMTDTDGMEISFATEKDLGGNTRLVLRIGGRRAARLDDEKQAEFLRQFHGAQLAADAPPEVL